MSFDEPDPEVLADLALRKASEHDSSRTRTAKYDWSEPEFVGQWKCRRPECTMFVGITEDALNAFCTFNDELRRRGEATLEKDSIVWCPRCLAEYKRSAGDRRRGQVERMRVAIIELKGTPKSYRERELLDQLRLWGHPDVDGLTNWLRERSKNGNGKRKREL